MIAATSESIAEGRQELLRLRARIVLLERATLASLEIALRLRPEDLKLFLDMTRRGLSDEYKDLSFAPDLTDATERAFVADEVERLLRGLQAGMGFPGGEAIRENG